MGRTYLISDTHFNHKNIIKYENRPFSDVNEMNEEIIKKWNFIVEKNDKIFHLGDFGFGSKEYLIKIIKRLNGNKTLIMGNHDKKRSCKFWYEVGFNEVYRYPILYSENFILSHEPLRFVPGNFKNIHGHLHSKTMCDNEKYFNMSVECIDFLPFDFDIFRRFLK